MSAYHDEDRASGVTAVQAQCLCLLVSTVVLVEKRWSGVSIGASLVKEVAECLDFREGVIPCACHTVSAPLRRIVFPCNLSLHVARKTRGSSTFVPALSPHPHPGFSARKRFFFPVTRCSGFANAIIR